MQLRLDALGGHLKQATAKELVLLYVVHDDEHLLALGAVDALWQATRARGFTEREMMSVERGFSWSRVTEAQQSMSLLGGHKIAELRIPSGKPGKGGGEILRALAADTPPGPTTDIVTLITLPCLDFATAKSAWFTALEGAGASIKVGSVDHTELPSWIGECLARQQQRVEPGEPDRRAPQFIAGRVEGNLLVAHQGIQKFGLLHLPGMLTFDDAHGAVLNVARHDVFRLPEAILVGDVPRLVHMLRGLRGEDEATVLALWTLMEEIHVLSKIASGTAQGKPVASMLRELRVWGPRGRLVPQAARRLSQRKLEGAPPMAARLNRQAKRLHELSLPAEPQDSLLQLAMRVARSGSLPVPA